MLKTDYKNDKFSGSRKYTTNLNPDGTLSLTDVTVYEEEGDSFGAKDINETNEAVNLLTEEMKSLGESVGNGKKKVADAITDKGVQTAATATFDTMAGNILRIETGIDTSDATATAGTVLKGYTAYAKGNKITGNYTDFEVKGKKDIYTVQNRAISPGDWVNLKEGMGSDSKGSVGGVLAESIAQTRITDLITGYGGIAIGMTGPNSAVIHNVFSFTTYSTNGNYDRLPTKGVISVEIENITSEVEITGLITSFDRWVENARTSSYIEKCAIGRLEINGGVLISYPRAYGWIAMNRDDYEGHYILGITGGLDSDTWYKSTHSQSRYALAEQGKNAGTCIIQLSADKYYTIMRGYLGGNNYVDSTSYHYRSLIGFIKNATGLPPVSSITVDSRNIVTNNTNASASGKNYSWIRGMKISANQVFVLARLYNSTTGDGYHAMILNIGTSSSSIVKEQIGAYGAYEYNDMVPIDNSRALFVGNYSSSNYLRFHLWSYSTNEISFITANHTGVTDIISVSLKMIGMDTAMALTLDSSGRAYVTFLRISSTSITILSSNHLFTKSGAMNIDMCKVSDTKYLIAYDAPGMIETPRYSHRAQQVFTRMLTIPEANAAYPYASASEPFGVAVTGGAVGSSITVATSN